MFDNEEQNILSTSFMLGFLIVNFICLIYQILCEKEISND